MMQRINFNVHTYNNRVTLGNIGKSIDSSKSGSSFYPSSKDNTDFSLYVINIRNNISNQYPKLSVRKLHANDNLYQIER